MIPFSSRKSSLPLRQKCQPRRWMISLSPFSVVGIPPSSVGIHPQGGSDSQPRHSRACRNLGGGEIHQFWSTLRLPPTCAGMTAISPSSPGLTTHLPAFAVLREIAGFGIVRATRGNHSRCHAPSSGRAGVCCENRGGVLMESGVRTRVKTTIPRSGGFNPPPARLRAYTLALPTIPHSSIGTIPHSSIATIAHSSIAIDPQGGSDSICCSGLITARMRGVEHMDLEMRMKMKIIQFPENIDKLTSYFDKYLKSGR